MHAVRQCKHMASNGLDQPPRTSDSWSSNNSSLHDVYRTRPDSAGRKRLLSGMVSRPIGVITKHGHHQRLDLAQLYNWWSRTGSNRRPIACKATALPTELRPRKKFNAHQTSRRTRNLVGLDRLELSTSPLSGVRSNHLSYRPQITRNRWMADRVERAAQSSAGVSFSVEERETKEADPAL